MSDDRLLDELTKPVWTEEFISYNDLLTLDVPEPTWFIPGMIPHPALVAFTGAPGSFKTFFVHWLCMTLAAGEPLFGLGNFTKGPEGMITRPKEVPAVVFIEEEMHKAHLKERSLALKRFGTGKNFFWSTMQGFSLTNETMVTQLKDYMLLRDVKILVLDPFSTIAGLKDENSNSEAAKVMDVMRREFIESGITVIFIHHPAKGQNGSAIRGAGDILGKCDMHFSIEKVGEEPSRKILIKCGKSRLAEVPAAFMAELVSVNGLLEWQFVGDSKQIKENAKEKLISDILQRLENEPSSREAVASSLGFSGGDRKFREVWKYLVDNSTIQQKTKGSWSLT